MRKQLKIKFPVVAEPSWSINFDIGKRLCHACKNNEGIVLTVGGLNFLGNYSGTMFRASSNKIENAYFIPELETLSLNDVMLFAKNIVHMHETKTNCKWCLDLRIPFFNLTCGNYYDSNKNLVNYENIRTYES